MNDPLTQSLLSGPSEAEEEVYLACGHKFHKVCIKTWLEQGKPCPLCRNYVDVVKTTPPDIVKKRQGLQNLKSQRETRVVAEDLVKRSERYKPRGLDVDKGFASAKATKIQRAYRRHRTKMGSLTKKGSIGGKKNKYSRKKI